MYNVCFEAAGLTFEFECFIDRCPVRVVPSPGDSWDSSRTPCDPKDDKAGIENQRFLLRRFKKAGHPFLDDKSRQRLLIGAISSQKVAKKKKNLKDSISDDMIMFRERLHLRQFTRLYSEIV